MYSNAMWHVDWHIMKEQRFRGLNLVTYLDDASRCITAARLFEDATPENAVMALHDAIGMFGVPATILPSNGKCFVGIEKKPKGQDTPTVFESELIDHGISLLNSSPQRKGKLGRLHRTMEDEIWHYKSISEYVQYYNERRLHFSLDIKARETALRAFHNKTATKKIRESDPKWMEMVAN